MIKTLEAIYDGKALQLKEPLAMKPGTRVEAPAQFSETEGGKAPSILAVVRALHLSGPADFSKNLDEYLYRGKALPDE